MARTIFYYICVVSLVLVGLIYINWPPIIYILFIIVPYIVIGVNDIVSKHNILRNYPVIGRMRYMFESIRPQIRQYLVESDQDGKPFDRDIRSLVYQRAKQVRDTVPFGTRNDITKTGYEFSYHSIISKKLNADVARIVVGGNAKYPYNASLLNVSGIGFGALSSNAILALNKGALAGNFLHNTGEGGLTPYHLNGGDVTWQIGTAYFSCRTKQGKFDADQFQAKSAYKNIKMIELKISQGARPLCGALLPASKVTKEISEIRGVPMGEDVVSPPYHSSFSTPIELLEFIEQLRYLSGGKPVGMKLCIGVKREFMSFCKAMLQTGIMPDFITIDGSEGGTGAAPLEFTNRLGTPVNEAIAFVHGCLTGINLRDKIRIMASGKVATGYDMVTKIGLGADMCNAARAMMFALGCVQSLRCNTNKCPTGVATQDKQRIKGLLVKDKYVRVANYHCATVKSFLNIVGAMGLDSPNKLTPYHIRRYTPKGISYSFAEVYSHLYLKPGELLGKRIPDYYKYDWENADVKCFSGGQ